MHKTANILDKMLKSIQGRAKALIHEMYLSPTRKAALAAFDQFITSYQAKYPKANDCLERDKEWCGPSSSIGTGLASDPMSLRLDKEEQLSQNVR